MTIDELAGKYGSDKYSGHIFTWKDNWKNTEELSHACAYDRYLGHLRNEKLNILEMGILEGASLLMWQEAFPFSNIYGLDNKDMSFLDNDAIKTRIFDQGSKLSIKEAAGRFGVKFDIIIDDCSHKEKDQQLALGVLFPYLKPGGYYFIEDIDVSPDTVSLMENFMNTDLFISAHLTADENDYIEKNASVCEYANPNNILLMKCP